MKFKKLILEDYKIYYGEQILNLDVTDGPSSSPRRNLILVGGLNGAGKTTILNAIYYALFGRQGLSEQEYTESFTSAINDRAFDEGRRSCSISLTMQDKNETFTVQVQWEFDQYKKLLRENRKLLAFNPISGQYEEKFVPIEEYLDFINRRIPHEVAPFFIFDGEKIQKLVEKQDQKEMKSSIQQIVSLEVYKSLVRDLSDMQSSLERKLGTKTSNKKLQEYLQSIQECDEKIKSSKLQLHALNEKAEKLDQQLKELRQFRQQKLIQNVESKVEVAKRLSEYTFRLEKIEQELKSFSNAKLFPLLLAPHIAALQRNIEQEERYITKKEQIALKRQAKLSPFEDFMKHLLEHSYTPTLSQDIKEQLYKNGQDVWITLNEVERDTLPEQPIIHAHALSQNDRRKILQRNTRVTQNIHQLLNDRLKYAKLIEETEALVKNAPDAVDTKEEDEQITKLQSESGEINQKIKLYKSRLMKARSDKESFQKQAASVKDSLHAQSSSEKQYQFVMNIKEAAAEFVEEVTKQKAEGIRVEFQKILKRLARKDQDFHDVEFNEQDYVVRIYNDKGMEIKLRDRSAGEKQVIALCYIWALTKTAGLSLPFVIDTPLGRLDSVHRNHIVRHYFNELSDQVIILSTDTEVNKDYLDFIDQYAVRTYQLTYDQKKQSSFIKEGYFAF